MYDLPQIFDIDLIAASSFINIIRVGYRFNTNFSYFSLYTVNKIFEVFGLRIFDVESLATHGGSLRIYGCHIESKIETCSAVSDIIKTEISYGLSSMVRYEGFQAEIEDIKNNFLQTLINFKNSNQ